MMETISKHGPLQEELGRVLGIMRESVRCSNVEIQTCIDELLGNPGKMLRPSMVILSAHSTQRDSGNWDVSWGNDNRVHRLAAAIEIMHMATLVHDDVIDGAATRRKRPSVFASHGARVAILLGDLLFSAAFQLVADLADTNHTSRLSKAVRVISESEILQINRIDPSKPGVRQYLHQIIGKTAVLFALSCRAGAELLGASGPQLQALQRTGYNLGMAFQIMDDIMDLNGSESVIGKSAGLDLQLGLLTLPVLSALRKMQKSDQVQSGMTELLLKADKSFEDIKHIREIVQTWKGFDEAKLWVQRYTDRALRELQLIHRTEARELFTTLTLELAQRQL